MAFINFDLERNFAFYGAYHTHPVNVFLHLLFVWPLIVTTFMVLHFTPPFFDCDLELWDGTPLVFNLGFVVMMIHILVFVYLDKRAGSFAALLCLACWLLSSSVSHRLGFSLGWKVALAANLSSWGGQFLGHGFFEKRAPAFLTNPLQVLMLAPMPPFFVVLDVLSHFGYEPYPGFRSSVEVKIADNRREWLEQRKRKAN